MRKEESCLKEFLRYVSLNVLGMIGLSCYILADTFFVSKGLGADGLTALNLAIPVFSFVSGSGMMLGMGGATKYSVFKARKRTDMCLRIFMNTVYTALFFSVFFVFGGLIFSPKITALLGAEGNIFKMTNTYLKVIMLFSPAFIMNNILNCYVRNDGSPKLAMVGMLLGSLSNIIFDYIFIFPMKMGILGAVLATGCSPVVGIIILSFHFRKNRSGFKFTSEPFSFGLVRENIFLGIPSLITEASSGVVMIIFNTLILGLEGNIGVAAYGVTANISIVVIAVFTGIAQGLQPVSSQAYGEGNFRRSRLSMSYALITVFIVSLAVYLFIFLFSKDITLIFNSERNEALQNIAEQGLRLYFIGSLFAGVNIVTSVYLTSIEKAIPAQIISFGRGFAVIVPLAFLMAHFWGIRGIWLTFPVSEFLLCIFSVTLFVRQKSLLLLK